MTHFWRVLTCSRARATANRLTALLMALLLFMPMAAVAAPSPAIPTDANAARDALEAFAQSASAEDTGKQVGRWFLHPAGFAFRIPDGFEPEQQHGSTTVLLVDRDGSGDKFLTCVSVAMGKPDKRLKTMSQRDAENAFDALFRNFELVRFSRETIFSVGGIRVSYLTDDGIELFFDQCMFNKDGHSFVITLTVERNPQVLAGAWRDFESLLDSFIFLSPPPQVKK